MAWRINKAKKTQPKTKKTAPDQSGPPLTTLAGPPMMKPAMVMTATSHPRSPRTIGARSGAAWVRAIQGTAIAREAMTNRRVSTHAHAGAGF
ncbi:MAG: hypothetical protein QOF96_1486, partial [Actinomycetota bacterium]|nr:hypothetical protein [Actinomycetota bacterium]